MVSLHRPLRLTKRCAL